MMVVLNGDGDYYYYDGYGDGDGDCDDDDGDDANLTESTSSGHLPRQSTGVKSGRIGQRPVATQIISDRAH